MQQNNATATQPTSGLEHADDPHTALEIKRKEEEQVNPAIKTEKKEKKRSKKTKAEKFKNQERGIDEILEPPLQSPPPPPTQLQIPSTTNAFRDWYLAKLADNFESEIEALNNADARVGSKVLVQALESNLALFSPPERKVALAAEIPDITEHI